MPIGRDAREWRAGYDGAKRKNGGKVHMAVDTLGYLLALHVTPANQQERAQVDELARQVQAVTGGTLEVALLIKAIPAPNPPRPPQRMTLS